MARFGKVNKLIVYLGLIWGLMACESRDKDLPEQAIATNNRGVALMGNFDYGAARDEFARLVESQPEWLDARINLAIATLNRQQTDDEQLALEILSTVLNEDPDNLSARYISGLLHLYLGNATTALDYFRFVAEADPGDAFAAYYTGQSLLQLGRSEHALDWYLKAIAADTYLRSAYYSAALVYRRLGNGDKAREMLAVYQRFADNPRARLAEFKYTRMGPKAEAKAPRADTDDSLKRPDGALFSDVIPIMTEFQFSSKTTATAVDLNADGHADIYLTDSEGESLVLFREGDGFTAQPEHPLSGFPAIRAAAWGDINNDGLTDLLLCGSENSALLMANEDGWINQTAVTDVLVSAGDCAAVRLFDADHDGDLDIFKLGLEGANELFNNNRDGTFRTLAAKQDLTGHGQARGIVLSDIDGDRDVDILVWNRGAPNEIWLNDRLWEYRKQDGDSVFSALLAADLLAVASVDANADAQVDLVTVNVTGQVQLWQVEPSGTWSGQTLVEMTGISGDSLINLDIHDADGDGQPDLWLFGPDKSLILDISVYGNNSQVRELDHLPAADFSLPILDSHHAGMGLFQLVDNEMVWSAAGPGRFPFISLRFSGMDSTADSMRSNASGIGTAIALRLGGNWSLTDNFSHHSGAGQSLQPISLGLAGRSHADYVALNWSDGVFQTELALASGQHHHLTETQRQLSSCPVLFVWDGQQYRFVTDLLGVGGLGFFVAPGVTARPRPWENVLLTPGLLQAKQGRLSLKLTEPMEENAYIDHMALTALDVPKGWELMVDERMAISDPQPSGRWLAFRASILPTLVSNERNQNVTATVIKADGVAAPVGKLDHRFIGRLVDEHVLDLFFDQVINPAGAEPWLLVDGWIEYPYSQTVFAAWQADEHYQAPTLEARTTDGKWQVVAAEFGYPAGMPRQMAYPLDKLPAGSTDLRLRTNQEVYWDRIRVVWPEPLAVTEKPLSMAQARLRKTGYPLRTTANQRRPNYSYAKRQTFWDTKYLPGMYTALGPVEPLVSQTDDAMAIIGPGEELHLEFVDPGPVAKGYIRYYLVRAEGYAKDMDLYTRDGESLGPLPRQFSGNLALDAHRDSLHKQYNIRFQGGFNPPDYSENNPQQ